MTTTPLRKTSGSSISIGQLLKRIRGLRSDAAVSDSGKWYTTQKQHWIGWLNEYGGPGAYGRQSTVLRSAEYAYNHIVEHKMLAWLVEAAGLPKAELQRVHEMCACAVSMQGKAAAVRCAIPWSVVAGMLWPTRKVNALRSSSKRESDMAKIERAISIRQPYVEQILNGTKKKEFRSMATNIRERVYLYASAKPKVDGAAWRAVRAEPGDLPAGAIVGSVEIVDCKWDARRECYAYSLARPMRIRTHLMAVNQPRAVFWRPQFK